MTTKDPRQVVISKLTNADPRMKREERGILARPESIHFLKEKSHQYVYACVVSYISTTNQEWYDTSYLVQYTDGSFIYQCGVHCKAEHRFLTDQGVQPHLSVSGGGEKPTFQAIAQEEQRGGTIIQEKIEGGVIKQTRTIVSISLRYDPAGDVSDYRFLVGYLTANGQDVASVRLVPHEGYVEEDEVQDDTVLFLGKWSQPITFEFYSPSRTLIASQFWDI